MKKVIQSIRGSLCVLIILAQGVLPNQSWAREGTQAFNNVRDVFVSVSFENTPLSEVFSQIEQNTEFRFVYDKRDSFLKNRFTLTQRDVSVESILIMIAQQSGLKFKQLNNNISVSVAPAQAKPEVQVELVVDPITVRGRVASVDGESLPGVTVLVKGSTIGTSTDVDGMYTINAPDGNGTLAFSFIGYVTKEVPINNRTTVDVILESDVTELSEVVVIGYGTVKKSDLTGSVASVTGDDLKKVPVATVAETLTGRMAGVQVTSTEGSPDAEIKIRVRGGGSITQDNTPLYIVDGFPVASISDISPSDIQSIDVLKDASSTAIYGSRGANGVIIITTKGGTPDGKLSVSYNAFLGYKEIAKTLDVLQPEDYVRWQYEYAALRGDQYLESYNTYFGPYQDIDLYNGLEGNDWQRQVYGRIGNVFSNDFSIRGGSDKFNYSVNYARFEEKAIMIGSDYVRNNITLKLNNKPNDKVELAFSLRYSDTDIRGGGANEQNEVSSADSRLKHSVSYSPIPVDGITAGDDTNEQTVGDVVNPIRATYDNDRLQERRNYNMGGSFIWNITDAIQWRTDVGLDNYLREDDRFYGLTTYFVKNRPAQELQNKPAIVLRDRNEIRYRNTNTVSYNFKNLLSEEHNLRLLLGEEMLKTEVRELSSEIHGFPAQFTSEEAFKLTTQGTPFSVDNNFSPDDKLLSFFGRLNYDFKGRYLFSATYRADGSSKFLDDNQWGYFPSAAVAWKVSEESFMDGTSNWLNQLKLRASFGTAGNNNIPPGQTFQSYESSTTSWMNNFSNFWAPAKTMANPDLKWETTQTRNIGLDFGILKGRLGGTVEAYHNSTTDLLILFPVSGTGYDNQYRNMGETENKGIEVSLNYIAIDKPNYGLSFNFNISYNRNEIVSLGVMDDFYESTGWASTQINRDYLVAVGRPVGMMFGFVNDGRYEVSDFEGYDATEGAWILKEGVANSALIVSNSDAVAPGMMKLQDINGDNIVNNDDMKIIGNANPKNTGGLIINGYAYGFDLTAAFNWSYGNDIYNANKIEFTTANQNNQYRNLIDMQSTGERWTNIDPASGAVVTDPTTLADMNANTTMWSPLMRNYVFSDWAVEDGSFLRLNTLTLGYTLPSSLTTKLRLTNLRFYATGYNVFILTDYSGFDPEVSTRRKTPLTPGVDYSAYPRSRQIVFGLNLSF